MKYYYIIELFLFAYNKYCVYSLFFLQILRFSPLEKNLIFGKSSLIMSFNEFVNNKINTLKLKFNFIFNSFIILFW